MLQDCLATWYRPYLSRRILCVLAVEYLQAPTKFQFLKKKSGGKFLVLALASFSFSRSDVSFFQLLNNSLLVIPLLMVFSMRLDVETKLACSSQCVVLSSLGMFSVIFNRHPSASSCSPALLSEATYSKASLKFVGLERSRLLNAEIKSSEQFLSSFLLARSIMAEAESIEIDRI